MADSIELQAVNAIAAALAVASVTLHTGTPNQTTYNKPTGLNIHRMRLTPIEHDDLPSMLVYILGSPPPVDRATLTVDRVLRVGIESRQKIVQAGDPPDDQMDQLKNWTVQSVMADETLGGVAHQIKEADRETMFETIGEVFFGRVATVFEVDYQTLRDDPEIKS